MMKNIVLLIGMIIMPFTLSAQEAVKGHYVSSFERSDFMPCGSDEHWWLHGNVSSKIRYALQQEADAWRSKVPVYIEISGTKSEAGNWGHLGAYRYEFKVTHLLNASLSGKCDDVND